MKTRDLPKVKRVTRQKAWSVWWEKRKRKKTKREPQTLGGTRKEEGQTPMYPGRSYKKGKPPCSSPEEKTGEQNRKKKGAVPAKEFVPVFPGRLGWVQKNWGAGGPANRKGKGGGRGGEVKR